MKNPYRHIVSALFSSLLLLPLLALGFLQLGRSYIQSQREERVEKKGQVEVVMPADKVVWEEEGKELWIGKRMFDVASFKVIDGQYHLVGVYDEDETKVAGSLLHLLLSKNDASLLRLLLLLQCFCVAPFLLMNAAGASPIRDQFFFFISPLFSRSHLVLGPPPRQLVTQ